MPNWTEDVFRKNLQSVTEIIKRENTFFTKEQIHLYFADMQLTEEQEELIYQYLKSTAKNENEQKNSDKPTEKTVEQQKLNQKFKDENTDTVLPNTRFFQMYLSDLEAITACSLQEEEKLYEQLIFGDERVLNKLLYQWLPRLIELVKKQNIPTEEVADIVQEGNVGVFLVLSELMGSGRKLDYHKMIYEAAQNAINAYIADTQSSKELEQSLLTKASFIQEAHQFLIEEYERIPTLDELSQYTRLSIDELSDILRITKEIQDN